METLSETLKSLYRLENINDIENITNIVEQIQSSSNKLTTIIYFSEKPIEALEKVTLNVKIIYFPISTIQYSISDECIKIFNDDKKSVKLSKKDISNTLIYESCLNIIDNINVCYLLEQLQLFGFTLINNIDKIKIASNKYLTAKLFERNNISQPKFALLTSSDIVYGSYKVDDSLIYDKLKTLYDKIDDDTQFVCKILDGCGGSGVFLCRKKNIVSILQCIWAINENVNILVQNKENITDGDIRVHVVTINGKSEIFEIVLREKSGSDFRTNTSLGNKVQLDYQLTNNQKQLVLNVAKISGLTWCAIDLLHTVDNKDIIIEINGAAIGTSTPEDIDKTELLQGDIQFFEKLINTISKLW